MKKIMRDLLKNLKSLFTGYLSLVGIKKTSNRIGRLRFLFGRLCILGSFFVLLCLLYFLAIIVFGDLKIVFWNFDTLATIVFNLVFILLLVLFMFLGYNLASLRLHDMNLS